MTIFSHNGLILSVKFISDWFLPWRSYLAEFLGTFIFVLLSCWVLITKFLYAGINNLEVAIVIGFSYAACVFATANLSGGFLNPALTLALWLSQKLSGVKAVFFIVAQILASFAASLLLLLIFGTDAAKLGFGGPTLGTGVSLQTAVLVEAVMTASIVFVTFATMVDKIDPASFGPLVLGLIVVGETIAALPVSGAAFNPARAIGPAVLSRSFDTLAVWIIGPLSGSLVAVIYELVFLRNGTK